MGKFGAAEISYCLLGRSIQMQFPLKDTHTAIEKTSTGIDSKFDSLSITVEFSDLQIFHLGGLLIANFYA